MLVLLTLCRAVFGSGDTYALTDDVVYRTEIVPEVGLAIQVNQTNPVQGQINIMWSNYMVAIAGARSTTRDEITYGVSDTKAGTEETFVGAYLGYIPGEFRIIINDRDFVSTTYLAFGLGWQHTRQLYVGYIQGTPRIYAVSPQERWDAATRLQLGTIFSYRRVGLLLAVGSGTAFFGGLQMNLL